MSRDDSPSPFHRGEREVQARLGVRDQVEGFGRRFIRNHLPEEHREFYAQLPFLLLGSIDGASRPWASVVAGHPGFIAAPDSHTLRICAARIHGDPLEANLKPHSPVGVLGIHYETRRRNRLTAKIGEVSGAEFTLKVSQAFGNCPQYIQARRPRLLPGVDTIGVARPTVAIDRLNDRARRIVSNADHFYIATSYVDDPDDPSHGVDVSHRGGKPGFVRIENDRSVIFPDFAGNNHYNTIGNITLNPRAGLLFIDFDGGELLYLTCAAEIIWDGEEKQAFAGAKSLIRLTIDEGLLIEDALPIRWNFLDYSPVLDATGSWDKVDTIIASRRAENRPRNYRVTRVERESDIISSYYLVPDDSEPPARHKAGQFLPVELYPPDYDGALHRTYTISSAPNGEYYRLSIKREQAYAENVPPGLASSYFHDHVQPGSVILAYPPRGRFFLPETGARPVVLLSGGVGVTPMISMLGQLRSESGGCGCDREIWFIHAAKNGSVRAFGEHVRRLASNWPCLNTHFVYSEPRKSDVQGRDYDSAGRIDIHLLERLLPPDDYDYYLCGPASFMQSIYDDLKGLDVGDSRIHYEYFGPGKTLHDVAPERQTDIASLAAQAEPVAVRFARCNIETTWYPSKGSLLDLAEAEGLSPVYSCRSGICSTCQTTVVKGTVAYASPPIAEPETGKALICCAYPSDASEGLVLDL